MSAVNQAKKPVEQSESSVRQSLIGRQPILDQRGRVRGYELLFRPEEAASDRPFDGNHATANVIVNALTEFGLENVVGPHRGYINFTGELLRSEAALLLPKDRIVIEILEDVAISPKLIAAVSGLAQNGYELALDDFVYSPQWDPLIELATTIKLDVLALNRTQIESHVKRLKRRNVKLLAEKVETAEEHAYLLDLGFDLFQGYYYAKPNIVSRRRIPENKLAVLRLLAELNNSAATMDQVERLITEDVSLSYRLLRLFNSAFFSLPQKVDSVRRALIYFGIDMLRHWASLLVMANVSGKPEALMQNALVRARMCEGLAKLKDVPDPESYFTVGLFSILDSLLDTPMTKVVDPLPLSPEIVDALVNRGGDRGAALRCVCAYEECRWAAVEYGDLDREAIGKVYLQSIEWAFDAASGL